MNKIGDILKAERISQGKALKDIERETKIRAKYLIAIEKGDLSVLPGGAYHKAFIKAYCRSLGIDSHLLLTTYQEALEKEPATDTPEASYRPIFKPRYKKQLGLNSGDKKLALKIVLALVLLALLYLKVVGPLFGNSSPKSSGSTKKAQQVSLAEKYGLKVSIDKPGAWIKVSVDGKVAEEGVVVGGTKLTFGGENFKVITGNAAATMVSYKGSQPQRMGSINEIVIKNYGGD